MRIFLLLSLLAGAWTLTHGQEKPLDAGQLVIFSGGQRLGAETFTIQDVNHSSSQEELTIGTTQLSFTTQTAYRGLAPLSFVLEQPTGRLQFAFAGTLVKLTGPRELTAQTDAAALLLENNVWHQYFFALARYDQAAGGVQPFQAFVPSIMQTLPLTIERKLPLGTLLRYEIKGGPLLIDALTLPDGKLAYLGVPAQKAEAVRAELLPQLELLRAALTALPPDYSAPPDAAFTAEEVVIKVKNYQLAGTLLLPKTGRRPFPAVVTITGSGQQTRDEPIPYPNLKNYGLFRQVAEYLASRGIAVLRVDDRGVGSSTGGDTLLQSTTSDFANDTRAQIAYLRTRQEIDPRRIALAGHSEGGSIAPQVAVTDPQLAAIVLMAGPGLNGADISRAQQREALASHPEISAADKQKSLDEQNAVIQAVISGGDLSKYPPEVRLPWIKEFWSYDPLPTMRRVRQPVLILQGALDQQITAGQADALEKAARAGGNKTVTKTVFPTLNHLFLPAKTGSPSEYSQLTVAAVPENVLQTMALWLRKVLRTKD